MSESDVTDKMMSGKEPDVEIANGLEEATTPTTKFTPVNATANVDVEMEVEKELSDSSDHKVKITPKKRAGDKDSEDSPSPKKKLATSKAKNGKSKITADNEAIKAKKESLVAVKNEGTEIAADGETSKPKKKIQVKAKNGNTNSGEGVEPVTPKKKATQVKANKATTDAAEGAGPLTPKKKRSPVKPKTPKTEVASEDESPSSPKDLSVKVTPAKAKATENTTEGVKSRKRAPVNTIAPHRVIPASWEEATDADKMLKQMRDAGKDWGSIRAAWKEATGVDTGTSTLPNRYNRIKVNMMSLKDGDAPLLLAAKIEVERKFENEKWALIADAMEAAGTDKYPAGFLQKKFKEISTTPAVLEDGAATTEETGEEEGDDEEEE